MVSRRFIDRQSDLPRWRRKLLFHQKGRDRATQRNEILGRRREQAHWGSVAEKHEDSSRLRSTSHHQNRAPLLIFSSLAHDITAYQPDSAIRYPAKTNLVRTQKSRPTQTATTFTAVKPLNPSKTSYSTLCPSASVLNPSPYAEMISCLDSRRQKRVQTHIMITEKCTKMSLLPSSGVMNPKPLASLNHLTVPLSEAASVMLAVLAKRAILKKCIVLMEKMLEKDEERTISSTSEEVRFYSQRRGESHSRPTSALHTAFV